VGSGFPLHLALALVSHDAPIPYVPPRRWGPAPLLYCRFTLAKPHLHDRGYNAFLFNGVRNCWVRRVRGALNGWGGELGGGRVRTMSWALHRCAWAATPPARLRSAEAATLLTGLALRCLADCRRERHASTPASPDAVNPVSLPSAPNANRAPAQVTIINADNGIWFHAVDHTTVEDLTVNVTAVRGRPPSDYMPNGHHPMSILHGHSNLINRCAWQWGLGLEAGGQRDGRGEAGCAGWASRGVVGRGALPGAAA